MLYLLKICSAIFFFRKDLRPHFYLSKQMPPQTCEIQKDDKLITPAITANNNNKSDTSDKNKGTVLKLLIYNRF